MSAKRNDNAQAPDPTQEPDGGHPETGSGKGRRDVVGHTPDDVRVDPNITEGHPGYEESGDSEIIPAQGTTAAPKK